VTYYKEGKNEMSPNQILDMSTTKCYDGIPHDKDTKRKDRTPDIILIDSLAAFTPDVVHEGDLGDANMGKFSFILKQWMERTLLPIIRNPHPGAVIFTNHLHPRFDVQKKNPNMPTPTQSAGGVAVGYYSTQAYILKKLYGYEYYHEGGYVLQGNIKKNRDGFGIESKNVFFVYIQAGEGVSANLTAVIDCVMYGFAKSSAEKVNDSSTIKMDGRDYGKFRDLIANRHDPEMFTPFHNALRAVKGSLKEISNEIGS
jgi:hypothetical protein